MMQTPLIPHAPPAPHIASSRPRPRCLAIALASCRAAHPVFVSTQCPLRFVSQPGARLASKHSGKALSQASSALGQMAGGPIGFKGMHHVALLCADLEKSMEFYQGVLGLEINPARPHEKLPYRGAWLWIGPEMIHLMELPNPDPLDGRPEHGGRDRHFCVGVDNIKPLTEKLKAAGIKFTMSMSGRPAMFFRDPDMNVIEVVEQEAWR